MTVPEVRRLLLGVMEVPTHATFHLSWSWFRRRHQAGAHRCHAARRARRHPSSVGMAAMQVLSCVDFTLTDEQWARIAPLLPPQKPPIGRPTIDHRTILARIFWVIRTGASWREVPASFGPWQTINSRYRRWRQTGIWQRILEALNPPEDTVAS